MMGTLWQVLADGAQDPVGYDHQKDFPLLQSSGTFMVINTISCNHFTNITQCFYSNIMT